MYNTLPHPTCHASTRPTSMHLTTPIPNSPNLPHPTLPNQDVPELACHTKAYRSRTHLNVPCRTCQYLPCIAMPLLTEPCHACHKQKGGIRDHSCNLKIPPRLIIFYFTQPTLHGMYRTDHPSQDATHLHRRPYRLH